MKGTLLDAKSLGTGLDFSSLQAQLEELTVWPGTQPQEVMQRIEDAEIVMHT